MKFKIEEFLKSYRKKNNVGKAHANKRKRKCSFDVGYRPYSENAKYLKSLKV